MARRKRVLVRGRAEFFGPNREEDALLFKAAPALLAMVRLTAQSLYLRRKAIATHPLGRRGRTTAKVAGLQWLAARIDHVINCAPKVVVDPSGHVEDFQTILADIERTAP